MDRCGDDVELTIHQLGLENHFLFAGIRSDVPRLMKGAMDVFLFPSSYEGLPLVLIEAQAAGLGCVFSDVLTEEVQIVPTLTYRLPLSSSPSVWASAVTGMSKISFTAIEALNLVTQSPFNIEFSCRSLAKLYHTKDVLFSSTRNIC